MLFPRRAATPTAATSGPCAAPAIFLNVTDGQTDHEKHLKSSVMHSLSEGLNLSHFNIYMLALAASQRIHSEGNHIV